MNSLLDGSTLIRTMRALSLPIQSGLWSSQGTAHTHTLSTVAKLSHFVCALQHQAAAASFYCTVSATNPWTAAKSSTGCCRWSQTFDKKNVANALGCPPFPHPPCDSCLRHITPQFNYELVFEFIMPLSKRGRPITRCTPLAALQSQSLYLAPSRSISLPRLPFAFYLPELRSS